MISKSQIWFFDLYGIVKRARTLVAIEFFHASLVIWLSAFVLAAPDLSIAQTPKNESKKEPVFIAPEIGIPAERLGAGTRDVDDDLDGPLYLLVPKEGGYTSLAKPPLVWRITSGFRGTIQARVVPADGDGVSIERRGAFAAGYYAFDLERTGFDLTVGETYRFSVSLVSQNEIVARTSTLIERVSEPTDDPGAAGIWFDTLAPLVSVDLSGRVRVTDPETFDGLIDAGGIKQ